jgi:hypothetical protein
MILRNRTGAACGRHFRTEGIMSRLRIVAIALACCALFGAASQTALARADSVSHSNFTATALTETQTIALHGQWLHGTAAIMRDSHAPGARGRRPERSSVEPGD